MMWKYNAVTSKVNDANQLKVGLKGDFELNPQSLLYKMVVSKYRILTPFSKRHSDLEFFWDKKNKNVVMNKFYAKAKIDKDGSNVANVLISTNQKPYKFHVFLPAILGKLRPGMQEPSSRDSRLPRPAAATSVRSPGTARSSARETSPPPPRSPGRTGGTAPTSCWTTRCTSTLMALRGSLTSDSGHFKMTAVGKNARWGDYSVNRDLKWGSSNKKLSLDITGDAEFGAGPLASSSPVQTEVKLNFDVPSADLNGKFMKVFAGKEYSITFNPGFNMPSIKVGA